MSTNFNRIFSDSKVESTNVGKIYEESTAGGNCNLIIDNNSKATFLAQGARLRGVSGKHFAIFHTLLP